MIILLDNYDSFTFNVVQALSKYTSEEIKTIRSKEVSVKDLEALNPSRLIVSPGAGRPEDAGVSLEAIKYFAGKIPIMGVCLGHQCICQAFGAKIVQAKDICHGQAQKIALDGKGLFRLIGKEATFTRYHSLVVDEATLPKDFEVTARSADGDVMGVRHKTMPIEGVQFHPESVASEYEKQFFTAFLNYRVKPLDVSETLNTICAKKDLSAEQAAMFMEDLTEGCLDERKSAAILSALAVKGYTSQEVAACAKVLNSKKVTLPLSNNEVCEIVGTGGDGKGSFNISSMSALVAASCGVPMAKHGNRAVSSKSGAANFYTALGIKIDVSPEKSAKLVEKTGFAFLFAPIYHAAMRFAGPVRGALGIKTIMNLMGPLSNPANATYQMLGVYDESLLELYAHAAKMLGPKHVMVVHSEDGFDEISPCAKTSVFEIDENGKESQYKIDPAEFGITGCKIEDLAGGTGDDNAKIARQILAGKANKTVTAAVCLNAGAAMCVAGKVATIKEGYNRAKEALAMGAVQKKLDQVVELSNAA
ncbi:MAG: anthranilate phosphoribosyltransferase [Treponema sp. CETP13]|nr:MAG: anthranilate phosphoribosyltransferase [Treponema sp. CETP13]